MPGGKKRKKSYYIQSKRSKCDYELKVGIKGFFITCNKNEGKAVTEAYKLFNEYAEKLDRCSERKGKQVSLN